MENLKHYKFSMEDTRKLEEYVQPCLAELIGTTLFIALGCLSFLNNPNDGGFIQPALVQGLALGAFITTFGALSGGHFNPAVSLSVCIAGGLAPLLLIVYVIMQMVGGILGAFLAKSLKGGGGLAIGNTPVCMVGTNASLTTAFCNELVFSFILILIVLMTAQDDVSKSLLAPFAVAFFVTAAVLASASISGACMNPARAFGPAIIWHGWDHHWIYWAGPGISAFLMPVIYRILLSGKSQRWVLFGPDRCLMKLSSQPQHTPLLWGTASTPPPKPTVNESSEP